MPLRRRKPTSCKSRTQKARFAFLKSQPDDYDCVYNYRFSPDEPTNQMAPVGRRDTPYVEPPLDCTVDTRTGTITCINNSNAFLDNRIGAFASQLPFNNQNQNQNQNQTPQKQMASVPLGTYPYQYGNIVNGSRRVPGPPDSPLNQVLSRPPTGPWTLVGYVTSHLFPATAAPTSLRMLLYAQNVDQGRNRYNYRVVDSNGIPIDVSENVFWLMDGDSIQLENSQDFTVHLYQSFR